MKYPATLALSFLLSVHQNAFADAESAACLPYYVGLEA
jgi:hypothetical protein